MTGYIVTSQLIFRYYSIKLKSTHKWKQGVFDNVFQGLAGLGEKNIRVEKRREGKMVSFTIYV